MLANLLTPEELVALAEMFKKLAAMGVMALSSSTHAADSWGQEHVKYHLAGDAVRIIDENGNWLTCGR